MKDADSFYQRQMTEFFSVNGELAVSEAQRQQALQWCTEAGKESVLACMIGWGSTDFRADLKRGSLPALVIHGDSDASVPFGGSAKRTHDALPRSELCVIAGGPHGCNISHPDEFNEALVGFLASAGLPRPAGMTSNSLWGGFAVLDAGVAPTGGRLRRWKETLEHD